MADEDIVIRAILEDETSDPAERIQRALDELGRANRDTADDTDTLTESQRRNTDEQRTNRRETDDNTASRARNSRSTRQNTSDTDSNTSSQRRNTKERDKSSKSAKDSSKVFSKLSKLMMPLGKGAVILDAISMAGPAVGALGAAGIAAGAGLAQMSGAALPLPALMLGAGQAVGVLKMATSGLGDASKALMDGDFSKFAEATKDMDPAAVALAKSMGELGGQFKNIKRDVQGTALAGLAQPFSDLGNKLMPMVRQSFLTTAKGINVAATEVLRFGNSAQGISAFRTILNGTGDISYRLAASFGAAGKAGIAMGAAVMPVAQKMGADIADGITGLSNAILANQGKITAFADRGYALFKRLVGILVDLGKGIYNIGKLSGSLGSFMGTGLEDAARSFKDWTESAAGQQKITQMFENAKPVLSAIANLIKQVALAFGGLMNSANNQNLVDVINKLAEAVPTLASLAQQASGGFIQNLLQIATAIASIVDNMNALGPASLLMSAVAEPMDILAKIFNALPGPIQQAIGYIVMFGLALKTAAGTAAGQWVVSQIMATSAVSAFRTRLALAAWGVQLYAKSLATAAMGKFRTGVAAMGTAVTAVGRGFRAAAVAVRVFSMSILSFLFTNPIGWIILAVVALIAVFVLLWKKCEGFRNVVKSIGQWFVSVWNGVLFPMIMKVWDWMRDVWNRVYGFIKGIVMGIVNWFKTNWDTIKTVATTVFNVIKTVVGIVFTVLKTYVMVYLTVIKFVFNIVKTVVVAVFNFLKPFIMAFFTVIKAAVMVFAAVFRAVWFVIKAVAVVVFSAIRIAFYILVAIFKIGLLAIKFAFTAVFTVLKVIFMVWWTGVKAIFNVIVIVWTAIWNAVKAVFSVVWNAILAVIRFLTPVVMTVLNFVKMIFTTVWNAIVMVVTTVINIIMNIIRTIIGVVSSVLGVVFGIWNSVWNTFTGIVGSVIGVIRGIIDSIVGVVSRVTNTIRNAFTSAFGAIRDFVMPIINTIKNIIDRIKDAASGLANTVGNLVSKIPGLATGGIPVIGQSTMVGEVGPEAFVTHTGKVSMVGTKGPEVRQFHQPGYVVPSHVLATGVNDGTVPRNVMSKLQNAMSGVGAADPGSAYERAPRSNLSSNTYMQEQSGGGGNHYDFRGANFGGGNPGDVKAAVKAAIAEAERERRQRGH